MSLVFRRTIAGVIAVGLAAMMPSVGSAQGQLDASARKLRICADPNNLPFSNNEQQGFENRIATLIAQDLGRQVEYFWFRQGGKFFGQTLNRGVCDVVMGVPFGFDQAATTRPYYRSTYVVLSRANSNFKIDSLDDPRLHSLRIGVQILGDGNDNLPPVAALMRRGIVKNLVGFSIFGNLNEKNPASDVVRALEKKDVDVAIVWGPLGGYFSRQSTVSLRVTPLKEDAEDPDLPFHFDIAIGVRAQDDALRKALDRELTVRHSEIENILRSYGIPQVDIPTETAKSEGSTMRRNQ